MRSHPYSSPFAPQDIPKDSTENNNKDPSITTNTNTSQHEDNTTIHQGNPTTSSNGRMNPGKGRIASTSKSSPLSIASISDFENVDDDYEEETRNNIHHQQTLLSSGIISTDISSMSSSSTLLDLDSDLDYSNIPNDDHDSFAIPNDLLDRLRTFSLFKNAPPMFHRLIARRLKLIQYHPQEYIVKAGEPAKSMYWILRGTVGVTSTDGEATYAELVAGSFFGEIGILFNRPRTATVVARTRVLLGVLTKRALNEVLPDFPIIERLIRDEAQERLAMQEKKKKAGLVSLPSRRNSFSLNISGVHASLALSSASSIPGPSLPPLQHNNNISPCTSPDHLLHHQLSQCQTTSLLNIEQDSVQFVDDVDESIHAREFLKSLPIFKTLPSILIHELALGVDLKKLDGFEYVFKKGDSGTDIFFIVAGQVEIIDPSKSNAVLARLEPGKYFGEMAFLSALSNGNDGDKRSADIRTVLETVLMIVTGQKLQNICERYPLICEEMKQTAGERCKHNGSISSESDSTSEPIAPFFKRISFHSIVQPQQQRLQQLHDDDVSSPSSSDSSIHSKDNTLESNFRSASPGERKTSVSPFSDPSKVFSRVNSIASTARTSITSMSSARPKTSRKRSIQEGSPLEMTTSSSSSSSSTTNLAVPPLNPHPTINTLQFQKTGLFQYMPLAKRLRLNNNNSYTRRRSSALSTGPLNDRIMLQVFAQIDLKNLMKMRRVCRRWRQLLLISEDLFKVLNLSPWNTSITDQVLKKIIDFVGPRPSIIDISNCFHITDEGFSYLVNEIGIKGSIKVLKMKSVWKVSAMAIMDLSVPSIGHHLEAIELVNCRNVRDDVMERLIGGGVYSEYDGYKHTFGCLNLKYLDLSYCKHLTDKTMSIFAEHCSDRLETLILTRCTTITDNGFRYWSMKQFPKLTTLVLRDCTFLTDNSMIYLATLAPNLRNLDLSFCCALNDSSIDFLCFCCKNLQNLNLSFCGSAVSDISLVSISRLNNLQKLIIVGCLRVTREGVDRLLAGSRSLSLIDLGQCKNAHDYPYGGGPGEVWVSNPGSRSLFIKIEPFDRVIEIIL